MLLNDHDHLQQAILGCLLTWPEEIDKVSSILSPVDFTKESYRTVFQYLMENEGGDLVTVATALKGKVNAGELATWISHEVTSAFLPRYCQQLKEISRKVQIFETAGHVRLMFTESSSTEMLEKLEALTTVIVGKASREPSEASALVVDAARRLKSRYENCDKIQGVPFGYVHRSRYHVRFRSIRRCQLLHETGSGRSSCRRRCRADCSNIQYLVWGWWFGCRD